MSNSFLQQRLPTLLGIFAGMGLLIWALFSDERLIGLLFQPQGLALIIGGTLTACLIGFSWQELSSSFSHFLICFSGFDEPDLQDVYDTTVYLARQIREAESPEAGQRLLEDVRPRLQHPLLKEGLGLVVGGYTAAMIRETLETTLAQTSLQKSRQIRLWKFMGQMAPAFGLAGALLVLLQAQGLQEPSKIFSGAFCRIGQPALRCAVFGPDLFSNCRKTGCGTHRADPLFANVSRKCDSAATAPPCPLCRVGAQTLFRRKAGNAQTRQSPPAACAQKHKL